MGKKKEESQMFDCCVSLKTNRTNRISPWSALYFLTLSMSIHQEKVNVTNITKKTINVTKDHSIVGFEFTVRPTCTWGVPKDLKDKN